jgi:xanthine/CO dehydrogenase XdhC/CoxF family maturation factor
MRDILSEYDRLAGLGRRIGRAVVTSVWGSAPRSEGSSMLATTNGEMAGSVSGGCIEGATVAEIGAAIIRGSPRLVTFGVSDERAWEVGLACGGTIKVFVEPEVRPEILAAARGPGGEVVATVVEGPAAGSPHFGGRPASPRRSIPPPAQPASSSKHSRGSPGW